MSISIQSPSSSTKNGRKYFRRTAKAIMRSHRVRLPTKFDIPLRLRPWFLLFTSLIMITLAFLGFTNFSRSLPLNDKLLHFVCFMIATAVFYFIFDVEEDARRVWFWRYSGLIFTGVVCFFFGGLVSEFVQSMLPYKEFQFGDVAANLLGSAIGLSISFHLEKYYRHRREIARLYRPLDTDAGEQYSDSDSDTLTGTQLLPTHHISTMTSNPGKVKATNRLENVWDEREEFFGIGESDEENADDEVGHVPQPPKIVVTST